MHLKCVLPRSLSCMLQLLIHMFYQLSKQTMTRCIDRVPLHFLFNTLEIMVCLFEPSVEFLIHCSVYHLVVFDCVAQKFISQLCNCFIHCELWLEQLFVSFGALITQPRFHFSPKHCGCLTHSSKLSDSIYLIASLQHKHTLHIMHAKFYAHAQT